MQSIQIWGGGGSVLQKSSLNHVFVSLLIPTCTGSEAIPYTFSRD